MNDQITQTIDNFSNEMLNMAINGMNEVAAQKDQTIKELKKKISDLEGTVNDLDYLLTSGKSELRRELRKLQQKLAHCNCEKEAQNA